LTVNDTDPLGVLRSLWCCHLILCLHTFRSLNVVCRTTFRRLFCRM